MIYATTTTRCLVAKNNMHIVNLISGKDLGGPKQAFVHYSDNLRDLGQQVTSIIRPGAQVQSLLDQKQLPYQFLDYPRSRLPGFKHLAQYRLHKLLVKLQPDLLLVHKPIDAHLAKPVLNKGCRLALVLHSYTATGLFSADIILAVSEPVKEFVVQQGFKGPVWVIPNLVEITDKEPLVQAKQTPLRIAHMGIMRRTKGQDMLLEALVQLHTKGVDFRAIMAGKGRWFKKVQGWIEQANLSHKINLQGWVSNQQRDAFIDAADVICIPSRSETFGMLAIEAMARKKLVLVTRCGGPEGIITHLDNGFLADINSHSLAAQLEAIIALTDTEYQAICERAYQHVLKHYSTPTFRLRLQALLDQL